MSRFKVLKDGEPCSHRGCLNHVTHPCEVCGRIAGIAHRRRTVCKGRSNLTPEQHLQQLRDWMDTLPKHTGI